MKPKDIIPELNSGKKADLDDTNMWGLMVHCLDCFEKYQDLRSIETKVVDALSDWILKGGTLITPQEVEWCDGIAKKDFHDFQDNVHVERWSKKYAVVTVVLRKLLNKLWTAEGFRDKVEAKRSAFEKAMLDKYGQQADWTLVRVTNNNRYGELERTLQPLVRPEEAEAENGNAVKW